jgi:hypothetical protein
MIEDRHVELIHAELDGELTPEQRAELSRLLLANPEARVQRDQLARVFGALERLEQEAPPPGFSDSVLAAIGIVPASPQSTRRSWYTAPAFRYAAVFVAGLLLAALLFGPGARQVVHPDVSDLVGTIGQRAGDHGSAIDRVELDLVQVRGVVNSYQVDGQLVVELDLKASEPIEVVARHAGRTVHMSLGHRSDAMAERVIWLPTAQGDAGSGVELEIYGGDQLIHRGSLRASRDG